MSIELLIFLILFIIFGMVLYSIKMMGKILDTMNDSI